MRLGRLLVFAAALVAAPHALTASADAQLRSAAAPQQPIPAAVFARLPQTQGPQINSDGTAVAAKIRSNGQQVLAIIPLDAADARPTIVARDGDGSADQAGGERRIVNWDWVDADNLLVWIQQRASVEGQPVTETRIAAYNRRTRQTTELPTGWRDCFVNCGNVIWASRQGPPRILLSRWASGRNFERIQNAEVISVDVATGRHEVVISPRRGVQDWYADGEGNVRLGLSFDRESGRLSAFYRRPGETNFRTIISQRTERYRDPPVPQIFLPNDRALVLSRHENFTAVYEMDLNTLQFGRRVFNVEGYDVGSVSMNQERNGLGRVSVVENRTRHYYFEPRLREIQTILDETFGAGNALVVSADDARENLVLRVAAPNQAGGYYLYRTETGDFRHIGWVNSELRDMQLNPVRTIRYPTSDGKTVAAVLTLPRLREHRNLPLIVLPHGGPWARDDESFDIWAQPLAEMGYAVIQPNFRGSSGYGYEWEAASDGNWGIRMQDDLIDGIAYLAGEGIADRSRVCIMGWSYGGYAASRAAQRDGRHYRCAISGAGVHDIPNMVAFDRTYLGRHGSSYIGSAASRLVDISPARFPQQFSIPILIVHGALDRRVPVAQSRDLVARLRGAGKQEGQDFVYLEQPQNTHNLGREADRIEFIEAVQRFLAQHNPAN
jgi:dipeptidyl aminopeptidase/acylaminoacyl peptidase